MTSAWDKALLARAPKKLRRKFEVVSVEKVREGTWRLDVDLGSEGRFPVSVYANGTMQSGVKDLLDIDESDRKKLWAWVSKNLPEVQVPSRYKTAAPASPRIRYGRVTKV